MNLPVYTTKLNVVEWYQTITKIDMSLHTHTLIKN